MKINLFLALFITLLITSCDDKKDLPNDKNITKEIIKTESLAVDSINQEDKNITITPKLPIIKEKIEEKRDFVLIDSTDNKKISIIINDNGVEFKNLDKDIVILNFFASWCSPCVGQAPYLSDLQKKYKKYITIMGLVVNEDITDDKVKELKHENHVKFFLSNDKKNNQIISILKEQLKIDKLTLPLAVIYYHNKYYIHYEGAVPIEMMESDILQILNSKNN